VRAPVLCPTSVILLLAHRELFAVTDGRKTVRWDSEINEVTFHALCSLGTQCEVVLVVSTLVTMPFNLDPDLSVGFKPRGVTLKYVPHIRANIVTIKVKGDVSERTFLSTFAQSSLLKSLEA
jgi:hypothetical protein